MTRRFSRFPTTGPRGITLTEILISIMILAIGLVSLATLFPLGLLRLREAQRSSRTAILSESSAADLLGRGILSAHTFIDPTISPWYSAVDGDVPRSYDPWIQDTATAFDDWSGGGTPANVGAYRGYGGMGSKGDNQSTINGLAPIDGPGLPVAYDPLWWYQQGTQPYRVNGAEARFGDATNVSPAGTSGVSGLQRLTNFWVYNKDGSAHSAYAASAILSAFISPEDIVWQDAKNTSYIDFFEPPYVMSPSPVIPDLTIAALENGGTLDGLSPRSAQILDWRYTWMFTGQRSSAFNDKVYNGDLVIFENRPFGFETLVNQNSGTSITQVAGERVVQAIFGYGKNLRAVGTLVDGGAEVYQAVGADNAVLLLWPRGMPDPEIRPGGWIADVTYERGQAAAVSGFQIVSNSRAGSPPAQRCYWYQVRRASPPADSVDFGDMRYTLIQTTQKLHAKALFKDDGTPVHGNAALVSPHVIGVVPKTLSIP